MTNLPREISFATLPAGAAKPQRRAITLDGGYETSIYVYRPAGNAGRLPVVYLHGIQSHPGWFAGSCAHLAGRGWPVYAVTRRGSGDNVQDRGHCQSAEQLLGDVETACRYALSDCGANKVVLVGVSWGGKLASCYAAWPGRTVEISSLTLVAPGFVPKVDVNLSAKLAITLALVFRPHKLFNIPLSDVELFTNNERMRRYLRNDAHRLNRATAKFLYSSRKLDVMLSSASRGAIESHTTLILASTDRIIDNGHTQQVIERLTANRAAVKTLPGCHTLEFEEDPQSFYSLLGKAVEGNVE